MDTKIRIFECDVCGSRIAYQFNPQSDEDDAARDEMIADKRKGMFVCSRCMDSAYETVLPAKTIVFVKGEHNDWTAYTGDTNMSIPQIVYFGSKLPQEAAEQLFSKDIVGERTYRA